MCVVVGRTVSEMPLTRTPPYPYRIRRIARSRADFARRYLDEPIAERLSPVSGQRWYLIGLVLSTSPSRNRICHQIPASSAPASSVRPRLFSWPILKESNWPSGTGGRRRYQPTIDGWSASVRHGDKHGFNCAINAPTRQSDPYKDRRSSHSVFSMRMFGMAMQRGL